jgi:hypothetical protein
MNYSITLKGCQRLVLPNNLLPRRNAQQRFFKVIEARAPSLSFNEVKQILGSGILENRIP